MWSYLPSALVCRRAVYSLALLTLYWLPAPPLWAQALQSLESITEAVVEFVRQEHEGDDIQVEATRLDPRLRLAQCELPLVTFAPHAQQRPGHMTVGVRCEGRQPWTLYVPVRVTQHVEVLTLATSLTRGAVLRASDLRPVRRDLTTLPHGYFTKLEDVVGMEIRRPVRAGEILTPNAITQPRMVNRGDEVLLIVESGSLSVSAKAEALQDGALGERIQVRNLSSRRVVEAEVIDRHRVRALF